MERDWIGWELFGNRAIRQGDWTRKAAMNVRDSGRERVTSRRASATGLALKVLLVGFICHLSTEIVAHHFPPHHISPLWPTNAILLGVVMATPVRHWWAYALVAFSASVSHNARGGASFLHILIFLVADTVEVLLAAVGVRRFASGLHAFDSLRSLVVYIIAVVLAPFISAFVAASAGGAENYWFYWRLWFQADVFSYLTLAPAIPPGIACPEKVETRFGTLNFFDGVPDQATL